MTTEIKAAVPNFVEFKIFDEVWGIFNKNPQIEEERVIKTVAARWLRTTDEIDTILIKVLVYKEEINSVMFKTANIKTVGKITYYGYEPTNDTVTVKVQYSKGEYTLTASQKDGDLLSRHTFSNLLMVKMLVIGFYDEQENRIDERIFKKDQ